MGIAIFTIALMLAGYVWVRVAQIRRAEADHEAERARYRRMIAHDPQNVGAHEALGDSLRRAGRPVEARDCYQQALACCAAGVPDTQIRYKIRQVELSLQERVAGPPDRDLEHTLCPQCGATNPPAQRVCETCNAVLPYRMFREALHDKEIHRATAESAAIGLVLAVVLFVFQSLSLDIKGVLVMASIIVVGWRFLQALGPKRV